MTAPNDLPPLDKESFIREMIKFARVEENEITSMFLHPDQTPDESFQYRRVFVLVTTRFSPDFVVGGIHLQQRDVAMSVCKPARLVELFSKSTRNGLGRLYADVVTNGEVLLDPFGDVNYIRNSASLGTPWQNHNRPHY